MGNRIMALKEAKEALATVLNAAVTTVDHIPARIVPPVAIISPGSPYLEDGNTFGKLSVRLEVSIVAPTKANDTSTDQLDSLIEDVLVALYNNKYGVESVSQPYAMETGNATYLAATVSVNTLIQL
jgi:hypothetical protein